MCPGGVRGASDGSSRHASSRRPREEASHLSSSSSLRAGASHSLSSSFSLPSHRQGARTRQRRRCRPSRHTHSLARGEACRQADAERAELDGPPTVQERGGERGERKQAPHGELGAVVLSGRDAGAGPRRVFAANLVAHSLTLPLFSRSFPSPRLLPQQRSSGGGTAAVLKHMKVQLPKAEKRAII